MIRLGILGIDADEVRAFLAASAPQEQGCFLLLRAGVGRDDRRLVALDPILPPDDAWEVQGPDVLRPSARWISAAVSRAIEANAGLLFVHAHPDPAHPPALSHVDRASARALGSAVAVMLDGPFGAAVVHPHGWAAVEYDHATDKLIDIDRIWAVSRRLRLLGGEVHRIDDERDVRQVDALGRAHDVLRSLTVGVVGAGGLGSPAAEQLVRMGVQRIILVDHDVLDTPSNVRRIFGARDIDLASTIPPAKVDVVGRHLDDIGLGTAVTRVRADVRTEAAFRALLDADMVISATDTHASRATVNELVAPYFVPVIDVGVRAGAKASGELAALSAEVRVLTPTTPCLWCRQTISADVIRGENLLPAERDRLVRDGYLVGGIGEPAPSVATLTVLGSALATGALLSLLTDEGEACPSGYVIDGLFGDGMELEPHAPVVGCRCRQRLGLADSEPPPLV